MVTLERFQSTHRKAVATVPEERASEHPTLVQSLGPLLILYLLYTMVRWAVVDRGEDVGDRNADYLLRFETWLGIDFEHSVQAWRLRCLRRKPRPVQTPESISSALWPISSASSSSCKARG